MIRAFLITLTLLFFTTTRSQEPSYDTYTTDTLRLKETRFKKVVAFKLSMATLYVNYDDYKKSLTGFWKIYRNGMKGTKKAKRKGEYINPDYEPRWRVIDSVYTLLKNLVKTQDTISLSQTIFDRVGLGSLCDFHILIEQNQCMVADENNQLHFMIIRQTGSRKTGASTAYGGSAYFIPGQKNPFVAWLKWIT